MPSRKLVVEVIGDSKSLERTFRKASAETTRLGKATQTAAPQVKRLQGSYVGTTAAALAFGAAIKSSFGELFESQKVAAQTEAVLKSTGRVAGVTAEDVDKLATSLLNVSGVDDEVIKRGENLLLTFRNIRNEIGDGNDVFNQATRAALDMSVAMGEDMQSSALRLGKALNDPVRGLTALRRVGVQLTKAQEQQIKAAVAAGDTLRAQKIILEELNAEFGDSAKAAGQTLPGQLSRLRENSKNLGADLAGVLLPALVDITDALNRFAGALKGLNDGRGFKGFADNMFQALSSKEVVKFITLGPFFDSVTNGLGITGKSAGEKAGEEFAKGFGREFQKSLVKGLTLKLPPINTAGAEGIIAFFRGEIRQPGIATPFLDLQQASAEATKSVLDDLALIRRRITVLQGRLERAGTLKAQTDLQNAINQERQAEAAILALLQSQARARRAAAKEAAREAAERRREARARAAQLRENAQFRVLGLGPEGTTLVPGVKQLRSQLGRLSDAVKGTFLDTGKTRSLLANIRKLLSGSLGKLSDDVRRTIADLLADIDQQLKDHEKSGPRTKFKIVNPGQILEGLGLTPEQERAARARLSRVGQGGTMAGGSSTTAFGRPIGQAGATGGRPRRGKGIGPDAGGPLTVNLVVDKKVLARVVLSELQRENRRRSSNARGPAAGNALGV